VKKRGKASKGGRPPRKKTQADGGMNGAAQTALKVENHDRPTRPGETGTISQRQPRVRIGGGANPNSYLA